MLILFHLSGQEVITRAAAAAEEEEDFYAVLGLTAQRDDATERDIKSAWRKLSKMHHPDVSGETQRAVYQRIQRAYEILGDRRKRKIYDILGLEGVKKLEQPNQPQQQQHPLFQLFGGHGGMQQSDRGPDVSMLLIVSLEDAYTGADHAVSFSKKKICRACRGSGARSAKDVTKCPHCNGAGVLLRRVQLAPGFVQQMEQPCGHCGGKGKHIAHRCPACKGQLVGDATVTISVDVEAGTPEGHMLNFELEADQEPGRVPGDVLLTVVTAPHKTFTRKGDDLYMTQRLTLTEALLGFRRTFRHLGGHEVTLASTVVTQPGTVRAVAGEGMPRLHIPSEKGVLYVTYVVELPEALTEEQHQALKVLG